MKENFNCNESTKMKMAYALKELMQVIPFEKITVANITEKSDIHRQTFYYHFQDRYQLLDWLLNKEIIANFVEDFSYDNLEEKFYEMLSTIYNDKKFYQNAVKINMTDVFTYFSRLSTKQLLSLVNKTIERNNIDYNSISPQAAAEFFGFGLGGMIISWIDKGMKEPPRELAQNIKKFVEEFSKIV